MLKIDLNSRGGFHHGHIIDYCDMFMLAFIYLTFSDVDISSHNSRKGKLICLKLGAFIGGGGGGCW